MKGKSNRIRRLISIICMILVFTLAVPCVAEAAPAASWSVVWDKGYAKWYCAGRKGYFHTKDNTVYQNVNGKDKKIVSLDSDKGYMEISYGRGDWLYIKQSNVLYGYNLKTGKKKVVIRKYYPVGFNVDGCGPYVYSRAAQADVPNQAYVWKLSGGTAKRVGLLGNHVKILMSWEKRYSSRSFRMVTV